MKIEQLILLIFFLSANALITSVTVLIYMREKNAKLIWYLKQYILSCINSHGHHLSVFFLSKNPKENILQIWPALLLNTFLKVCSPAGTNGSEDGGYITLTLVVGVSSTAAFSRPFENV
jgi:hypothetical protein